MTAAPHAPGRRAGFTLVELLVAMTVIVVLATITIAVVPSAMDNDRTTDAAATIRQHLMIAKARATRENNGRGIRFIVSYDQTIPAKTNDAWATEMQYIEAAPTVVPNPFGLTYPTSPYVEFDHTDASNPVCRMVNVTKDDEVYKVIRNDLGAHWFPKLYCPVLGPDAFGRTQRFECIGMLPDDSAPASTKTWELKLFNYPTTLMGGGTTQKVFRFAIEPRSRPLLGEPNVPLPRNVCVDLEASVPSVRTLVVPNPSPPPATVTARTDYEVMFAPNGQVIDPDSSGQIYLWVRDYTKFPTNPAASTGTTPPVYDINAFRQGGEQQLIAIKAKTGALGVFPVLWPQNDGTYPVRNPGPPVTYLSPYFLAEKEAQSP